MLDPPPSIHRAATSFPGGLCPRGGIRVGAASAISVSAARMSSGSGLGIARMPRSMARTFSGSSSISLLRSHADPRRFDLLVHPLRQTEIGLVGAAVRVADDRRDLEAAREVEGGGGVVEDGLDVVAAADVERELDAGVDLGLVELGEVVEAAPVVREGRAGVDGVRGCSCRRRRGGRRRRSSPSSFANSIATDGLS